MADMAPSFEGMVFSVGLWGKHHVENINNHSKKYLPGGPGHDMSWLDGMTGCEEACNIEATSVTFSDFKLFE